VFWIECRVHVGQVPFRDPHWLRADVKWIDL
jgi:hypothetical protein